MDIMKGLNPAQAQAVAHRGGPAIVLAGPGAGKTKVLTTRTAALLREGVMPERILLLTFTRSAANTMVKRIKGMDERASFVTAGTFHSWGIKIINANSHIFGLDRPFTVLDKDDSYELIKKAMAPLKGQDNWPSAKTVANLINFAANTKTSIQDVVEAKAPDFLELWSQIEEVREAYIGMKLDNGLIDYDDVLTYLDMLLADGEIGAKIRGKYSHIMIDEYQDTNKLQLGIVHGLVGENGDVTIVGDPSQSIYGFRGGAPATMENFGQAFPQANVISLDINYRSTPEIVAIVNAIDKAMDIGFDRNLTSGRSSLGTRPKIVDVSDNAAEAAAIADRILADKAAGGEISHHAVLVRSTASGRRIEAEFISRGIPHKIMGGTRIDEAAHIRDMLSIARIVANPTHEPAWLRMLSRFRKIGPKAAEEIAKKVMWSSSLHDATTILREQGLRRRADLAILADAIDALAYTKRIPQGLTDIIAIMRPIWSTVWEDDWATRERDLDAVVLIAEEHDTLDSFLTTITLDASIEKEQRGTEDKPEEYPVTISTIHSAKGLEWKHVHLPSFVMGGMPSFYANSPEEMDEELRIFYVAASRAENTLTFYRPRFTSLGKLTSPSTFEPLILPFVDQSRSAQQKAGSPPARVDTQKRIDLRSRLTGHAPAL